MLRGGPFLICFLASALLTGAGTSRIAPGTLLVASEKLEDPNFAETVILVLKHDEIDGTLGVVLNRQADITLRKAFPQMKGSMDFAYDGGPVSPDAVLALLRSSSAPETAEHILSDIYSIARRGLLEKCINDKLPPEKFRVYLGYAGWGRGQLENEIRQGAWFVTSGSKYVFDPNPETLWDRLNRDTQSQVAKVRAIMETWQR